MTSFALDDNTASYQIKAFKPGQIQVNDKILNTSLIIASQALIENWTPEQASEITTAALEEAAALKPQVLLIGTGATQQFLPIEIYGSFLAQGIGVEIMDTAAACRTYNILTSENRKVVAALVLR
jgi:uncharacterized protein